jgi:hypothetical protein
MKIGKWIAILLLSNMLISSIALGQGNLTASANVKITIVQSLQINQVKGNLSFGEVVLGGVSSKIEKTPDKGILFEVNGGAGRDVVVDYDKTLLHNERVANDISNKSTIQFIPQVNTTYANKNYSSPEPVSTGNSYQLTNNNGSGVLYLWVGGEMDIDRELLSGNYSGEFSVTVSY